MGHAFMHNYGLHSNLQRALLGDTWIRSLGRHVDRLDHRLLRSTKDERLARLLGIRAEAARDGPPAEGVLVGLVAMLHATRAARRARRGGAAPPCGCAPVWVRACVKARVKAR